jgi:uncharacterized protein (DUF302 family)
MRQSRRRASKEPQVVEQGEGLTRVESKRPVDETVGRLQELLESKGVKVFALIDHSGEAAEVGMELRPTKVVVFGSPKAGTPLMMASPSVAIDLPLKALVAEDEAGKVWITWNDAEYLRARHGFGVEMSSSIEPVSALLRKAAE